MNRVALSFVLAASVAVWGWWAFVWWRLIVDFEMNGHGGAGVESLMTFAVAPIALIAAALFLRYRDTQFALTMLALAWISVPAGLAVMTWAA